MIPAESTSARAWGDLPAYENDHPRDEWSQTGPRGAQPLRTVREEAVAIRYDLSVGRWEMVAYRLARIDRAGTRLRFEMHDREDGVHERPRVLIVPRVDERAGDALDRVEPMSDGSDDWTGGDIGGDREAFHADD